MVRRLEAATRGEVVDQRAGGAAGRASDIERGASHSAAALVDDVTAASAAVDAAFASFDNQFESDPELLSAIATGGDITVTCVPDTERSGG